MFSELVFKCSTPHIAACHSKFHFHFQMHAISWNEKLLALQNTLIVGMYLHSRYMWLFVFISLQKLAHVKRKSFAIFWHLQIAQICYEPWKSRFNFGNVMICDFWMTVRRKQMMNFNTVSSWVQLYTLRSLRISSRLYFQKTSRWNVRAVESIAREPRAKKNSI